MSKEKLDRSKNNRKNHTYRIRKKYQDTADIPNFCFCGAHDPNVPLDLEGIIVRIQKYECIACNEKRIKFIEDRGCLMEWINLNDKLPENNQHIKFRSDDLWKAEGMFKDGKFVYSTIKGACFGQPTHWIPWIKEE